MGGLRGTQRGGAPPLPRAFARDLHPDLHPDDAAPTGQADGDDGAQARRILEDDGYQRSLPKDPAPPEMVDFSLGPWAALVRILLWVGLAVVVGLAIAWIVSRIGVPARDEGADPGMGVPGPLEVPLESAERLAAAGRFAEAIHVLLLETLAALSRAAQLAPSLTSREIVAGVPLPTRARDALVGLVLAVEISRFGGAPAGERDYRACLDRFHAFLETYRRGAPRAEGAPA
jgi:hypothetical protein